MTTTLPATRRTRQAPRDRTAIAIRLIAPSREELARAVQTMQLRHGPHIAFNQVHLGKRGEWLVYGTLFV